MRLTKGGKLAETRLSLFLQANPRYANVTEVRAARRAMVAQAAALEREVWRTSGPSSREIMPRPALCGAHS